MAVLKFLGTAASAPTKRRDNTSFLFKHKNNSFLIDCPGSISHKLLKVKEDYRKINKVIITHHHPDHIYGIVSLIHTQMHFNKKVTIFSNNPSIKIIKHLIKLFKLTKPGFPKIEYINVFENEYFFSNQNLQIKAKKNVHIKESFGLLFSFQEKKLFYSSDTSFSAKMLKSIEGINYLIHDCTASGSTFRRNPQLYKMHTCSTQLADYLKNNSKVTLIPIHFFLIDKKEKEKIRKEFSLVKENIIWVHDYQKIRL